MKGITRERTGLILKELFQVLLPFTDGIKAQAAIDRVATRMKLSEHENEEYRTGGRRFDKIVQFCTMDAVKAGWMKKNNGIWTITPEGKKALSRFPNPGDLSKAVSRLYMQWQRRKDIVINAAITEAEKMAWKEIDNYLEVLDPYEFQNIITALLEAMGYKVAWVSPVGKDGGMVFLAWYNSSGRRPSRIKVQLKRRKSTIQLPDLRAFMALLNGNDEGIFVTTSNFSPNVKELVGNYGRGKITLVDSRKLVELWIKYSHEIDKETRRLLPLKPVYFIAPQDGEETVERDDLNKTLLYEA
jgi:restriction system protein